MESTKLFCGIDISSATIEVCLQMPNGSFYHENLPNSTLGFKKLLQLTRGFTYHFVMESTGVYHLQLCFYLEKKRRLYSVANPLQVKRYIQMQLEPSKSDRKDAKHICMFGIERNPEPFIMPEQEYFDCRSINNAIESITAEITLFTNKIHALKRQNLTHKIVQRSYKRLVSELKKERKILEKQLHTRLQQWHPELVELVSSVISIGQRATALLIITTQGFKYTESYQQLISFVGLNPKEYTSGSSVRGRVRISKLGHSKLRNTMYMCSLNAMINNPFCKELYDRLVAKGKNKKVALIAVCTKLLKLVFGVVKSGVKFDRDYLLKAA